MPKGQQRSNKEQKKPKKGSDVPKPVSQSAVMPTKVTIIPERGKKAKLGK